MHACYEHPPIKGRSGPAAHALAAACGFAPTQVIWSLEGCTSPGSQALKLSARTWVLAPSPPTTRFIGLAAAVPESGASTCTQPRLLAATNSGRLLRLRIGEPVVEKAAKIEVVCWAGAWLLHDWCMEMDCIQDSA